MQPERARHHDARSSSNAAQCGSMQRDTHQPIIDPTICYSHEIASSAEIAKISIPRASGGRATRRGAVRGSRNARHGHGPAPGAHPGRDIASLSVRTTPFRSSQFQYRLIATADRDHRHSDEEASRDRAKARRSRSSVAISRLSAALGPALSLRGGSRARRRLVDTLVYAPFVRRRADARRDALCGRSSSRPSRRFRAASYVRAGMLAAVKTSPRPAAPAQYASSSRNTS